ncbi:MAG: tetratricopeptide repeat protein [Fimbriimonadaceae bacterium]|nr:tetratricopeptide repeat protein [Fimbriimonadaceae bacterium]
MSKVATLPFNAAEGTKPALGRQFSNFAGETVRMATGADINPVSFLTQIEEGEGGRAAFVNIADSLLERDWINQLFEQSGVDIAMDGLLQQDGEKFNLTIRFHSKEQEEPIYSETDTFLKPGVFTVLQKLVDNLAKYAEVDLPDDQKNLDFGTDDPEAFLKFLEGYDSVTYINQTQGRVAQEFSPEPAIQALLESVKIDKEFLGPYETLVQLCRLCAQYRLGSFESIEAPLVELSTIAPDDFRAYFALGELYQSVNDLAKAADFFEKAIKIEANEPSLYVRLGMTQMALGMPVNAERQFRKAIELEGPDKPSIDYLAQVLQQTNRAHEVPALWKEQVDNNPDDGQARIKYAISLFNDNKEEEGIRAFETALEVIEDNVIVKRYYAPVLAQKQDYDRAMDFYEDCLDAAPTDVPLLLEYAQTLQAAGREFEVPKILRDVLGANPDPNTRAQTLGWLIELEQPRRTEIVDQARTKMEQGNFEDALKDLRPLKNWLADYWKMWALMSSAYNALGEFADAEDSARRLLELFPGCEPAYGELSASMHGQGKHEEAYNFLRWAAQNMPQSLGVHVNLALAAFRSGRADEARQMANQIREAVGPNKELEEVLSEIG